MLQICPYVFAFQWCFLYAEHRVFLPHANALNEKHTPHSSFLQPLSNSCISPLVVAILLHHRCTDVLECPLYDVKIDGIQQQCPATLASFPSLSPNNFRRLSSFFNIPLSLAPFPRLIVVVLDTISITIVSSNEAILTIIVIVLSSWTLRHLSLGLWSSHHPFCCSPVRFTTLQIAACPHVGHSWQPILEGPKEGLRQGEVQGGAGRMLSRQLRNQMLWSGHSNSGERPTGWERHTGSPNTEWKQ